MTDCAHRHDCRPIVVVDAGSYSLSETSIAGVGLRLAEMARTLSRRYTVRVIAPPCADPIDLDAAELVTPGKKAEKTIASSDAVMFFDTPNRHRIELAVAHRTRIIGECRAPIEHMSYPSVLACSDPTGEHQRFLGPHRRLLEVSHHFICRSQVERAALISTLCSIGRITPEDITRSSTLDHLVSTVPVGFGQRGLEVADAVGRTHLADFLWTGGIWTFFEPFMLVEAMGVLRDRGVNATAAFLHAAPTEDTRPAINEITKAIENLSLGQYVHLHTKPLTQSERDQYVKAAHAYVCIARPGVENETGTRLRLRDTWLHGVPTIIDPWGVSSEIVARENLGIVLHDPSPETLAGALQGVKDGSVDRPGRRMERLYENSMAPFFKWLDASCATSDRDLRRRPTNEQRETK
ncbi:glycosyltransferase family 4 protein [Amycolatopsis cihanbeyliensis]|uniref:Glycosyltransferase involved in cell wall biosynthesis n=1 Tax=Amycolatopsis cihanbeyliensis TaxID=1128664 RepID=A0A542DEX5_AMYCI|nr:glycosyltransferase family 4 protein [Amycolatopsis cihanbeyliensis]TQJ01627.1 glycosyltransferase involved in cell wall biosynthesis [Amycolatopsis cihanbeyliensis]